MKPIHYTFIAASLILVAILYWGGNTIPPAKKPDTKSAMASQGSPQGTNTVKAASFDSLLADAKLRLPKNFADSVKTIENDITASSQNGQLAVLYSTLSGVYERTGNIPVAAYYLGKSGKLDNSGKTLTFAGQLFLQLMQDERSVAMHAWEAKEAVSNLEAAQTIQPDSESTKLALATAYIEGTGEPMRGVQILRDITSKKPDDIPANMLLGRMSIQSGQNDKAVTRFETILKVEPNNTEAIYFLAEAYEGLGNKQKAIELLNKCKELVNKPEFSKEIDQHINSLK